MAANGPRIEAYCYSEGPDNGTGAPLEAMQSLGSIEQPTSPTETRVRPTVPELFLTQLATWQSELDSHTPAGLYSITYDATARRVTIASTNATNFRPVMPTVSSPKWSGFTQTLAGFATSWTADDAPGALAELIGVTVEPAEDAARVELSEYRHGRSVAIAWGNHQVHRVQLWFDRSVLPLIEYGYLTTGRVRIWQFGDGTAYSPSNVDGYVDGFVLDASNPREDGDDGGLWTLELVVAVPR
jgi:hypothetical protein